MGGDLEDAVGGGVNDGEPCPKVFIAESGDNLCPRGGLVAEVTFEAVQLEEGSEDLLGEPVGKEGERLLHDDAHQFPVPCDGVFSGGGFGHLPVESLGARRGGDVGEGPDSSQTEGCERGELGRAVKVDMAEGIGTGIVVESRVGKGSDADAVQDDDDNSRFHLRKGEGVSVPGRVFQGQNS